MTSRVTPANGLAPLASRFGHRLYWTLSPLMGVCYHVDSSCQQQMKQGQRWMMLHFLLCILVVFHGDWFVISNSASQIDVSVLDEMSLCKGPSEPYCSITFDSIMGVRLKFLEIRSYWAASLHLLAFLLFVFAFCARSWFDLIRSIHWWPNVCRAFQPDWKSF